MPASDTAINLKKRPTALSVWRLALFLVIQKWSVSVWKASGDILHVGPATVKNSRYEWDDVPGDKFRTARTRSFKLTPPEGNSKYGANVLQSWMWDRSTIFGIKNVEDHVPQEVLNAVRNDENLILDSDDLTKDGFETVMDQEKWST